MPLPVCVGGDAGRNVRVRVGLVCLLSQGKLSCVRRPVMTDACRPGIDVPGQPASTMSRLQNERNECYDRFYRLKEW
jgi:hypothetical protein